MVQAGASSRSPGRKLLRSHQKPPRGPPITSPDRNLESSHQKAPGGPPVNYPDRNLESSHQKPPRRPPVDSPNRNLQEDLVFGNYKPKVDKIKIERCEDKGITEGDILLDEEESKDKQETLDSYFTGGREYAR